MSAELYPIGLDQSASPEWAARFVNRVCASRRMPRPRTCFGAGARGERPAGRQNTQMQGFFRPGTIGPTLTDTIMSVPDRSSMVSYSIHWVYYGYA